MDFKKLLENKVLLASVAGGIVLVLVIFIICGSLAMSNKSKDEQIDVSKEPLKEDVDLLTTDNLGKALEIQALLARNNIVAARAVDGTKSVLKLKKGDNNIKLKFKKDSKLKINNIYYKIYKKKIQ